MKKILIAFVLETIWVSMWLAQNNEPMQRVYIGIGLAVLFIFVYNQVDDLYKDRRRWLYVKQTTTAVRNHITNEKEECTPEQFEAAVDRMIEAADEEYKKLK